MFNYWNTTFLNIHMANIFAAGLIKIRVKAYPFKKGCASHYWIKIVFPQWSSKGSSMYQFDLIKKNKISSSAHASYECNNFQFTQTVFSSTL